MRATLQQPIGSGLHRKSEPEEVLEGVDLHGRTAVVTGGYSGIGTETVRALAARGARVVVPVRDPAKAATTLAEVEGDVTTGEMDLADLASVRRFAAAVADQVDHLDLLVNNAGIMACPEGRVGPGWERQLGVNHIGHFALTAALLPLLRAADAPRVVALSSIAHRMGGIRWEDPQWTEGYDKWRAYGQAKTANALFALALDRRLAEDGGQAFSVHPGGILTPLQRHLPTEEMQALGWLDADGNVPPAVQDAFKTPTQGAGTTLWAATTSQLADHGGCYLEDGDVAQLVEPDARTMTGVRPWAVDPEQAERLWTVTEGWLADA